MRKQTPLILACLLTGAILTACGPPQPDREALATEVAASIFATQTAQAPTPLPLLPTDTLAPFPPTDTPRPTTAPTSAPTPPLGAQRWFKRWEDPAEKAFNILVPQGWTVSGGTVRVNTDPTFQFEAVSGEARGWIEWHIPTHFWEPNDYTAFLGYAEGDQVTDYGFNFTVLHYYPAQEFIAELWLARAREEYPDLVLVSLQEAPEVAQAYGEPLATESSAAIAIATFTLRGKPMKAGVTVVTDRLILGPNYGIWIAKDLGLSAPQKTFDQAAALFSLVLSTLRVNPDWLKAEMAGRRERDIIIRSTGRRLIEMDYQMFLEEQASRIRIGQGWMEALGGTQTLRNPDTGETYSVPSLPGMDYLWADQAGDVVATELDVSPGLGFTRLEPVR